MKKPGAGASSAKIFSAAHNAAKTIRASTIYALWVHVLGRPIKDLGDSPNDYNIPNVIAYADFLNHTPEFRPYGLDLQQSDVVNVDTMGKLGGAIIKNFQDNGWNVTRD
jgi:hypothetical protein